MRPSRPAFRGPAPVVNADGKALESGNGGDKSSSKSGGHGSWPAGRFDDEETEQPYKRLSAAEAAAIAARAPRLSPWRVVAAQALVGSAVAFVAWAFSGSAAVALSALYGGFVVVLPAALMARGTTSPLTRISPLASAVGVMFWASLKTGASIFMLAIATRVVQPLSWPALLCGLVAGILVYWFALLWRGRSKN